MSRCRCSSWRAGRSSRSSSGWGAPFRESLDASLKDVVPLERELELLGRYIDIQRVRFGERLDVSVHAAAGTERALVPTLLLQPLVENSIKHGIAASRQAGRIAVEVARHAEQLIIEVEDDGTGFDADARDGVGLGNTRARLQALYGARHTLEVIAVPHGGTRVRMAIPWTT